MGVRKMREIKFRIFDKQEEEFLNEEDYAINFVGTIFKACLDEEVFEVLDADMYIVTQYTGLKDKNLKEIYEGDIIKYDFNNLNYRIEFINAEFIARRFYENIEDLYPTEFDFGKECEVLGNIYENPELLNDKLKAE